MTKLLAILSLSFFLVAPFATAQNANLYAIREATRTPTAS